MNTFAIGISGINATDNPGPGVPVAKCLRQGGWPGKLLGLGYDANDPGHYLPQYFDATTLVPYPCRGWKGIRDRLMFLRDTQNLGAVIPCLDAELPLYIRNQAELAQHGISSLLPTQEQFDLRRKECLAPLAEEIGCHYPRIWKTYSAAEMITALGECPLPAFVKGPYYKTYRCHHVPEALEHLHELAAEWGWPILLQEEVFGEEVNIIGVGVGDGEGGELGLVAIKKLTTTHLGKIWSGVTLHHQELLDTARRFCAVTRWRGPFELELIAGQDRLHMIEINPRFPAWAAFSAGVGINLPLRLAQFLAGLPHERHSDYPAGKLFMRYTDEMICDISAMHRVISQGNP